MARVDKLFLEDKFNPQDGDIPSLQEQLAMPLDIKLQKAKKQKNLKASAHYMLLANTFYTPCSSKEVSSE